MEVVTSIISQIEFINDEILSLYVNQKLLKNALKFLCVKYSSIAENARRNIFTFEETLFTYKIKRFPLFSTDRTLMKTYLPADDLQGEQNKQINKKVKGDKMTCTCLVAEKQFLNRR